jgi:hypothetical protein
LRPTALERAASSTTRRPPPNPVRDGAARWPIRIAGATLLILWLASPGLAQTSPLTLTVTPSQSSYGPGDEIALSITLENTSGGPVTASIYAPGNIRFKIKRDGKRVGPRRTIIHFDDDPRAVRVQQLMTLAPAQVVPIPFQVRPDRAITQVKLVNKGAHKAIVYPLSAAGVYTVTLRYKYTGPDTGAPGLFRGKTLKSNEATFTVL